MTAFAIRALAWLASAGVAIIAITVIAAKIYGAGYAAGEGAAFDSVEAANKEGIENGEALVRARRRCLADGRSWSVIDGVCH